VVVLVTDAALDPVRRPTRRRTVEPRPATQKPVVAVAAVRPLWIDPRTLPVVAASVAVAHPLVAVAVHVVQPEGVGRLWARHACARATRSWPDAARSRRRSGRSSWCRRGRHTPTPPPSAGGWCGRSSSTPRSRSCQPCARRRYRRGRRRRGWRGWGRRRGPL